MASVPVDLLINTGQGAKTIGELKKALREIKNGMAEIGDESSDDFKRLASAAAGVKDQMADINDRIDAFNPDKFNGLSSAARLGATGIQIATSAMALFGDQSEDVQKAMMKVQAAMSFAQAMSGIKDLKKEFQTLFAVIQANPIVAFITVLSGLAVAGLAIYKAFTDTSDATKQLTKDYENQKKVTSELVTQYDREIEILSAQIGKEHEVFEAKKKKIEAQILEQESSARLHISKLQDIKDNDTLYESYLQVTAATLRKIGADEKADQIEKLIAANKAERAQEDIKAAEDSLKQIGDLRAQLTALTITEQNRQQAVFTKAREDEKKAIEENKNEWEAAIAESEKYLMDQDARLTEMLNKRKEAREQDERDRAAYVKAKQAEEERQHQLEMARIRAENELRKKARTEDIKLASAAFGVLADLSKKNAKLHKAFSVAQTLVDTFMAAQGAYNSQLSIPTPDAPIRAAIAAGIAIAQGLGRVKAILAVDVDNPSASAGGAAASGGGGGGMSMLQSAPQGSQPSGLVDAEGNVTPQNQQNEPQRVYVLESDITTTQNNVAVIQNMATHR